VRKIHTVIDRDTLETRLVVYGDGDSLIRDPNTFCLYKGKKYSTTRMREILFINHLLTKSGLDEMTTEETEFAMTAVFGNYEND